MPGFLKAGILILVTITIWNLIGRLGVSIDFIALLSEVIRFAANNIVLVGAVVIIFALLARINGWMEPLGAPNAPQKIVLTTKETPAQIVDAANQAMMTLFLTFIGALIAFIVIVRPALPIPRSVLKLLPDNLGARLDRLTNQSGPPNALTPTPDPSAMPTPIVYAVDTFPFYNTPTPTSPVNDTLTPITTPQVIETLIPASSTPDPLIFVAATPVVPVNNASSPALPVDASPVPTPVL